MKNKYIHKHNTMFKKKRSRSKILKYKPQQSTFSKRKRSFKKKKTKQYNKPLIYTSTGLFIVALTIYTIYFSSLFNIRDISFNNNSNLSDKIDQLLKTHKSENLFTINIKELEDQVSSHFTEINQISINKKYPSTLYVQFEEFPAIANVINESNSIKKSYVINQIGYVIKEDSQNKTLPYIKIKSDEPINVESQIIPEKRLNYILDSMVYFQDKFGIEIIEANYKIQAREVHLLTEKGFYLWLDITKPFEQQLKKLKKILVKLDIYSEPLSYIDLRIEGTNGEKIIYKRK